MYKNIEISASLMCIDWMHAGIQLKELELSDVDYLHLDIIDGVFAPDFTMGSSIINCFREATKLKLDYHLMVEEPSRLYEAFKFGGDDYFTIHQECSRNLHRDLVKIRQIGGKAGVALSPGTPLEALEYIIEDVDMVLLMAVNPGFKGQPLVPQVLRKIDKLRQMIDIAGLDVRISVDGNVNADTVPEMVSAGADILVLGSSGLFKGNESITDSLGAIKDAIDTGLKTRT